MTEDIKDTAYELLDEDMSAVNGGYDKDITPQALNMALSGVSNVIMKILQAAQPSYKWSDKGANFESLFHRWAEYEFLHQGEHEEYVAAYVVLKKAGMDFGKAKGLIYNYLDAQKR